MLLRRAYPAVTNTFAVLRLFPMSDRDMDLEILPLRHRLVVLQRQLDNEKARFTPAARAFLAALPHRRAAGGVTPPAVAGPPGHDSAPAS